MNPLPWLGSFLVNPWLAVAGAALISVPILIHLLNKRKFRVVDWAAMDFLLDADKKNRRRVRLENLILLALRCLAVLLLGMLLARPFIPTAVTAGLLNAQQYERIIVLDDSLSLQARLGNDSAWEVAKTRVADLVRSLAGETQGNNSLTLLLTSSPEQPEFNAAHLGPDSEDDIIDAIAHLEPKDTPARLEETLQKVADDVLNQPGNVTYVVYVVTDLRKRDWTGDESSANRPQTVLKQISERAAGCVVVDVGDQDDRNLVIASVKPEGTLVEGVPTRFDVSVSNAGTAEAKDVKVRFISGDSLPLMNEIERIPAGETANSTFTFTFAREESEEESQQTRPPEAKRVRIEVVTGRQGEDDRLAADSTYFFPARVVRGIPALIIDGDPSAEFGRSESFYLRVALSPRGPVPSGVAVEVATEGELDAIDLAKYQVIFLCNIYRLGDKTEEMIGKLEKWVQAGGGLVIMPGDQVDESYFNEHYFRDGAGLSPIRLEGIRGDESEATWASLRVEKANHEVFQIFEGENNPFLDNLKTFRWWGATVKKEQLGNQVSVTARFNDVDDTPAVVEKGIGAGRVFAFTIPADADWTNWPSDPSYILSMQYLVRYLAKAREQTGVGLVGQPLEYSLDLTQYELDANLTGPLDRKATLQAQQPTDMGAQQDSSLWRVSYPETDKQGFYELELSRREGGKEKLLFATNVNPEEGNLQRIEMNAFKKDVGDKVQVLSGAQAAGLGRLGDQTEIWWYLLWIVGGVLCCEQLLGWWFGKGR